MYGASGEDKQGDPTGKNIFLLSKVTKSNALIFTEKYVKTQRNEMIC